MHVSVAEGGIEHLRGIHALMAQWDYSASMSRIEQWIEAVAASPNHKLFVAILDTEVCGWAVAEQRLSPTEQFVAEITGLVVSEDARRAGIGQRLVQSTENWARSQGLSRLVVRSNVNRMASHAFYPAVGFKRTKTTHVYSKDLLQPGSDV